MVVVTGKLEKVTLDSEGRLLLELSLRDQLEEIKLLKRFENSPVSISVWCLARRTKGVGLYARGEAL